MAAEIGSTSSYGSQVRNLRSHARRSSPGANMMICLLIRNLSLLPLLLPTFSTSQAYHVLGNQSLANYFGDLIQSSTTRLAYIRPLSAPFASSRTD